jgi:leucyl aminopeptidase
LRKLGVDVEILDVKAMTKLGMGALLGVAQGSTQPGRTVIMRWNGGKRGDRRLPLSARAFVSIPAASPSRAPAAWRT